MIAQADELHAYVTQRLFVAIQEDITKVRSSILQSFTVALIFHILVQFVS
jgi:hypothetical protein